MWSCPQPDFYSCHLPCFLQACPGRHTANAYAACSGCSKTAEELDIIVLRQTLPNHTKQVKFTVCV